MKFKLNFQTKLNTFGLKVYNFKFEIGNKSNVMLITLSDMPAIPKKHESLFSFSELKGTCLGKNCDLNKKTLVRILAFFMTFLYRRESNNVRNVIIISEMCSRISNGP